MTDAGLPPAVRTPGARSGVALCTYNGAEYLQAQLDSILAQTVQVDEIVVGDDGSSDATLSILERFRVDAASRGIRVEIIRNERNLGYVQNFSETLLRCTADILFLSDQDDVWHPDRVQVLVERFDAEPGLLMLHGDARLVDKTGQPLGSTLLEVLGVHPAELSLERSGRLLEAVLVRNFVTGATCALRRCLLQSGLPVPRYWSHDEWLAVVASLALGLNVHRPATIDYRQHGGNQIGASRRSLLSQVRGLVLFDPEARRRTAERLASAVALLDAQHKAIAPAPLGGLAALTWRLAWSRMALYRRADVKVTWIVGDAPRLLARLANACLAGGGWRGAMAACQGAWAGLRGRRLPD